MCVSDKMCIKVNIYDTGRAKLCGVSKMTVCYYVLPNPLSQVLIIKGLAPPRGGAQFQLVIDAFLRSLQLNSDHN